jgi:hypothetical protein
VIIDLKGNTFFTTNLAKYSGHTDFPLRLSLNRYVAGRYLRQIILARFFIFDLFLEMAATSKLSHADIRKRWLILQLFPSILKTSSTHVDDIFATLSELLDEEDYLKDEHYINASQEYTLDDILESYQDSLNNITKQVKAAHKRATQRLNSSISAEYPTQDSEPTYKDVASRTWLRIVVDEA